MSESLGDSIEKKLNCNHGTGDELMLTFEKAFRSGYGKDSPNSHWDKPFFNNRDLAPKNRFVVWIDLMGAANHMLFSLPKTACFIGKIHEAGIQAKNKPLDVSIHPIADGFYAICDKWGVISNYTARVMRSLAYCFETTDDNRYRFLVRAGIAYGRFVDGNQMTSGSNTFEDQNEYMRNVLVGCPLSWAYEAEHKAPPFGIYIDQSVTTHTEERVSWVLHRWWDDKKSQTDWAESFGSKIQEYLEWLKINAIKTRYPIDKHDAYLRAIKEYFPARSSDA